MQYRSRTGVESVLMMELQQIRLLPFELPMAIDRAAEFEKEALPHAASLLRYAMHIDGRGKAEAR
jgi:hypothetical protein